MNEKKKSGGGSEPCNVEWGLCAMAFLQRCHKMLVARQMEQRAPTQTLVVSTCQAGGHNSACQAHRQTDRHTHTHIHTHTRTDTPDTCPKPRTAQTVLRACATPHPWQLQTIRVHRFEQQTESAHTRVNIVHFLVCDFIQHEAKHDAFQLPVPLHCAWKST